MELELYRALFIVVSLSGAWYVTARRRRFDLLAVSFLAACIYAAPGFAGYAAYPSRLILTPVPLTGSAYVVITTLMVSNLLALIIVDFFVRPAPTTTESLPNEWPWEVWILTSLAMAGAAVTLATVGPELLTLDKAQVMERLGRGHILWATCASVGLVAAFVARTPVPLGINALLLVGNLFVGFRVEIVISIVAVAYVLLSQDRETRLADRWRLAIAVGLFGLAMVAIKYFLAAMKLADVDLLLSLARDPDAWRLMFANSEPFITQGILNEVLKSDFRIDAAELLDALYLLIPFSGNLGAEVRSFNATFQPTLFSSVTEYGLANNFWAQMWSSGGWPLLCLSVVIYHSSLILIDKACRGASLRWKPSLAVAGIYLAFYIHRNDLVYQLTLERRVLLFGVLAVIGGAVCRRLARCPDGSVSIRGSDFRPGPQAGGTYSDVR